MSFLKDMYTANTGKSSKRFIASIIILCGLLYSGYIVYIGDTTVNVLSLITTIFYSGILLFGATTADKLLNKSKTTKDEDK